MLCQTWLVGVKRCCPFGMFANISKTDKCIYSLSLQIPLLGSSVAGVCVQIPLIKFTYHNIFFFFVRLKGMQQPNRVSIEDRLKQKHKKEANKNYELSTYWNIMKCLR